MKYENKGKTNVSVILTNFEASPPSITFKYKRGGSQHLKVWSEIEAFTNSPDLSEDIKNELKKEIDNYKNNNLNQFVNLFFANMKKVEQSRQNGHLIYLDDYVSRYGLATTLKYFNCNDLKDCYLSDKCINLKYFEIIQNPKTEERIPYFYMLRDRVNAAEALEYILNNDVTLIDCQTAIIIAMWFTILDFLRNKHGNIAGTNYFNELFGSPKESSFKILLSNYVTYTNILINNHLNPKWVNLAFYFFPETNQSAGPFENRQLKPGDIVGFMNFSDYHKWNPEGYGAMYNGIYEGKDTNNEHKFLAFGLGSVTELQMINKLTELYNVGAPDSLKKPLKNSPQPSTSNTDTPRMLEDAKNTVDITRVNNLSTLEKSALLQSLLQYRNDLLQEVSQTIRKSAVIALSNMRDQLLATLRQPASNNTVSEKSEAYFLSPP